MSLEQHYQRMLSLNKHMQTASELRKKDSSAAGKRFALKVQQKKSYGELFGDIPQHMHEHFDTMLSESLSAVSPEESPEDPSHAKDHLNTTISGDPTGARRKTRRRKHRKTKHRKTKHRK